MANVIFLNSEITVDGDCSYKILKKERAKQTNKATYSLEEILWQTWSIKEQKHHLTKEGVYSQSCGFSSSHVLMRQLNWKEVWVLKDQCFQTVMPEKTLENPLGSKEIKLVNPKGNQPWIFTGRTDSLEESEAPILLSPDAKSWIIEKDPDTGKGWRQEVKGTTENEMVGWNYWLNGHEFVQTPVDSEGQGNLACYSPWGHRAIFDLVTEQQSRQVTSICSICQKHNLIPTYFNLWVLHCCTWLRAEILKWKL